MGVYSNISHCATKNCTAKCYNQVLTDRLISEYI